MRKAKKKPYNDFKFGNFTGSFQSDGAASMAVKGLIVRVTVIRQYPRTTTFEERGEPKQNRAEILLPMVLLASNRLRKVYKAAQKFVNTLVLNWPRILKVPVSGP